MKSQSPLWVARATRTFSSSHSDFLVITFKVPTGANKGTEPYDGYEMAQDYKIKLESDAEKAKAKAEAKAKKAKRDAELRKRKAEIAEKGK